MRSDLLAAPAALAPVSDAASPPAGVQTFNQLIDGFRARLDREIAAFLEGKRDGNRHGNLHGNQDGERDANRDGRREGKREGTADGREGSRLEGQAGGSLRMGPEDLVDGVGRLMGLGGKRLRPALVFYTYFACGGRNDEQVMPVALATELLHTYLLIHDDIMDHAEVRRGQPAAHARFRDLHRTGGLRGDADDFGRSVALLLGDLAHSYAVELFTTAITALAVSASPAGSAAGSASTAARAATVAAPPTRPATHLVEVNRCFSEMCEEVIAGQYLEYLLAHRGDHHTGSGGSDRSPGSDGSDRAPGSDGSDRSPASHGSPGSDRPPASDGAPGSDGSPGSGGSPASGGFPGSATGALDGPPAAAAREAELLRVLRLKSGRYTAERPIQLGALLAGASPRQLAELSRYGTAVGEAFQLQDDLLGVFGDPATVGKPVGDDLREGKFTLLIHHALVNGSAADRQQIGAALGNPNLTTAEVARVQEALERTGARRAVAAMIAQRLDTARQALRALDALLPTGVSSQAPDSTGAAPHAPHAAPGLPEGRLNPLNPLNPLNMAAGMQFLAGLLDDLRERDQ